MTDEGWIFEKPVNTLIVKKKELEIGKSEAVFYHDKTAYVINASYINNKFTVSDLKTIVAFLVKKKS